MARGKVTTAKRAGGRARSDAEEAMDDSQAELNDISAALNTSDKPAGESAGEGRPHLPDGLLQRRIEKEKTEKEQAIKEKELLEKQLDDMRAERGAPGCRRYRRTVCREAGESVLITCACWGAAAVLTPFTPRIIVVD
jgi:hypothetical protein